MYKAFGWAVIALGVAAPQNIFGQSLTDQVNFKSGTIGGVHLYGVSIYSGYQSSAYPLTGGSIASGVPGAGTLGPDVNYGAQATVGWQRHGARTGFSLLYSGGYNGMVQYSDTNGFNQSLLLNFSRQLSTKWTLNISGSGQDMTLAQFLNQPTSLGVITQLPTTFDDLAAAFSVGRFSDAQAASMLTGAPVLESPVRATLLGNRVLSYSVQAEVEYVHSSRLSFHFGGFSAGGENRDNGQNPQPTNYVMPTSLGARAGMGLSYALSPRTDLGLSIEEMRSVNQFQSGYTTSGSASLGRKMGMHWFLNVRGGGSYSRITEQLYGVPVAHTVTGGGSLGFRTYQHTLVASYDRTGSDNYGFAIGVNTTAMGSWNWHRPGAGWSIFANAGQQRIRNTGYMTLSGWQAAAGFSERLSFQTTVSVQYVYSSNKGSYYTGGLSDFDVHSIRVSLNWAPQAVLH